MHRSFVGPIFTIVRTGAPTLEHVVANEDVDDCDAALFSAQQPPITAHSRMVAARDLVGFYIQN